MERVLLEYLVNSVWQVPLIAAAAWVAVRLGRPTVRVQHAVWIVALLASVALPAISLQGTPQPAAFALSAAQSAAATDRTLPALSEPETEQLEATHAASADLGEPEPERAGRASWPGGSWPGGSWSGGFWSGAFPARDWTLTPRWTRFIEGVYLASTLFCLLRLLHSWQIARTTVRDSSPWQMAAPDAETLIGCCDRLRLDVPEVRMSPHTRSPLVLGARKPVLLLPEELTCERGAYEIEAVWWHELVHVRRHDYLANLLCRVCALPVSYHPAAHWIAQRVVRTREMVCDSIAAEHMASHIGYARSLVDLAHRINSGTGAGLAGTAMFGDGALEERVMELLRDKPNGSPHLRTLRAVAAAGTMSIVLGGAAIFHVTPTLAESQPAAPALVVPLVPVAPLPSPTPVALEPVAAMPAAVPVALAEPVPAAPAPVQAAEPVQPVQPPRALTPEEKERIDKELSDAQRKLAEALKNIQDGDIQKRVDEAMKRLDSPEFNKQMADAIAKAKEMNSPEMQKKIADAMAKAQERLNSPEVQRRLQELNSPEFKKRVEESVELAKKNAELFANSAEMQKRMLEMQKRLDEKFNSPEWKKQMEQLNSPEFRQQMEDMERQLKEAMKKFDDQQKKLNAAPPEERNSPGAKKESQRLEGDVSKAYLMLASASPLEGKVRPVFAVQAGQPPAVVIPTGVRLIAPRVAVEDSDKALYESGMDALRRGEYETARGSLQQLVARYPQSRYAGEATRAIAQSWDAEGTLALVHAEEQYQFAGVGAKPLGPGITPPVLTYQVDPEYTAGARKAKVRGTVLVNLWVDEQGTVQHVRVVRGLGSGLDEKAIDAVRQYKFKPALEDGKPVLVALNVEVNFQVF